MPRGGVEPPFKAYESFVLTIELPRQLRNNTNISQQTINLKLTTELFLCLSRK